MSPQRLGARALVTLLAFGCGGDSTGETTAGTAETTDATNATDATDATNTTNATTDATTDATTTSAATDDTVGVTTETETATETDATTASPAQCGDGVLEPGELCFYEESVPLGVSPTVISAVDLDDDAVIDLVTANWSNPSASVLWGAGDGTFEVTALQSPQGNRDLVPGDLNGDGLDDLVGANTILGYLVIHHNAGGRVFDDFGQAVGGAKSRRLALHDFNDDGALDVLVVSEEPGEDLQSGLVIRHGDGQGGFGPVLAYEAGMRPYDLAVADVDGDAIADVIVADNVSEGDDVYSAVIVRYGDGDGGLTDETRTFDVPLGTRRVILEDWDGDGNLDILTASFDQDALAILPGDGAGDFAVESQGEWIPLVVGAGDGIYDVAVIDLNQDGHREIIGVHRNKSIVTALAGGGEGTVINMGYWPVDLEPLSVAIADLNGDGWLDMAVANALASSVSVLFADY